MSEAVDVRTGVDEDDVARDPARPSRWRRDLASALGIYVATRVAQLLILSWMDPPRGPSVSDKLLIWDAGWFMTVAREGYPHSFTYDPSGVLTGNDLAFFPLYPWLIRAVHALGIGYSGAALTISWIAGAVAAVLIFALGRTLAIDGRLGERARGSSTAIGLALVTLVCAQPMSIVLSMGYTESLFIALVAGALLAVYRHSWLLGCLLGVAAGLTRPTGAALAVAIAVAAVIEIADRTAPQRARIEAAVAGLASLASVPAYILWVGLRVGDIRGWFKIQTAGWGTTFDYGRSTWSFIRGSLHADSGWVALSVVFIIIAATVALIDSLLGRGWLPLRVYGIIAFILVVGQAGYYHSKPRLLVPVLLIFLPLAVAAGRARPRTAVLWLTAYSFFGLWYGAYMITVWQFAI